MKIAISSELKLLDILRGAVRWQTREHGFSEADADCLVQAIDEAASNVILQTYAGRPGNMLSLELVACADRMEFILEDAGPKVNRESTRPRSSDDMRLEGLAPHFIQTYMDTSCYDASYGEGNRLKLVKFLPGKFPETK
ncbi:MAG: ATP-binding protein [Acidobacteria bacterium]|nr:ATP-binding protein [Acidobacteriota bacterium]